MKEIIYYHLDQSHITAKTRTDFLLSLLELGDPPGVLVALDDGLVPPDALLPDWKHGLPEEGQMKLAHLQ